MKMEELDIKVVKTPTLFAVRSNNTFCKLTVDAHVTTYKVNGRRCLGVTFDEAHTGMITQLERFCKDILLEIATVAIPWSTEKRQIVFIHAVGDWSPICLRNASQGASGTSTDEIENIEF